MFFPLLRVEFLVGLSFLGGGQDAFPNRKNGVGDLILIRQLNAASCSRVLLSSPSCNLTMGGGCQNQSGEHFCQQVATQLRKWLHKFQETEKEEKNSFIDGGRRQ